MKRLSAHALVLSCLAFDASAQVPSTELEFHFETVGALPRGYLDVGRIAAEHGRKLQRETKIRRRILLRLAGGPAAPSSARVWVALSAVESGVQVSVDGVPIGLTPRLIDPVHRVGVNVAHDVELTVPRDAAAGPFLNDLLWTAETE